MSFLTWFRPPHPLLSMFLAVTLLPAAGLIWLGWRLLQQDRVLLDQRIQERLERSADLLVAALVQKCLTVEQELADPDKLRDPGPGDGVVLVTMGNAGVECYPRSGLLYYPFLTPRTEALEDWSREGEDFEFRLHDYAGAIAAFRKPANSGDPQVRAGAQMRIARNLRKAGRPDAALASYQELASLDAVSIGGIPAGLLARRARCALLAELKREEELLREARALYADLTGGRWQLDHAAYLVHVQDLRDWIGIDGQAEQNRLALAAGAEWLWENWQAISRGEGQASGRQSLAVEGRLLTLLWKGSNSRLTGLIAGPQYLERNWMPGLRTILEDRNARLSFRDMDGHAVVGAAEPLTRQALRNPRDTGLPWVLSVASADPQADIGQVAARQRLLLAGLALLIILVSAGVYFTGRAFLRELAAARLQSDFVAAVSHEFRTPLASLRQLTENLLDGRVANEERRRTYYQAQSRATDRLHRLVEGLLDFGRMEAGVLHYRLDPLNAVELTRSVTEEFRQEIGESGHNLEFNAGDAALPIRGNREALTRVLWNLLDNAVKYSPGSPTVWIEVANEQDSVAIRVRDCGLGIAPEEQMEVYRKFYRGSAAKVADVKGTGIGLAMTQHIVKAHGGQISLESAPGAGSTFTVILPAGKRNARHLNHNSSSQSYQNSKDKPSDGTDSRSRG